MKILISVVVFMSLLLYIAGFKLTLKPFSISFTNGWLTIGIMLFLCGGICLKMQWYSDGLNRGKELLKEVMEEIKAEQIKDKK